VHDHRVADDGSPLDDDAGREHAVLHGALHDRVAAHQRRTHLGRRPKQRRSGISQGPGFVLIRTPTPKGRAHLFEYPCWSHSTCRAYIASNRRRPKIRLPQASMR
jgi:hypothetical protein